MSETEFSHLGDGKCPKEFQHYYTMNGGIKSLRKSTEDGKAAYFRHTLGRHNFSEKDHTIAIPYGKTSAQLQHFFSMCLFREGHISELLGVHDSVSPAESAQE
uniref:Uncharacterized protein n=1 Tax=Haptolina brevifila TaxID=156173 RepID=A0A7S2I6V4_9EUKA